ncbi:MAG: hypothetical protein JF617_18230, partial [Burkholderiales bacterium]|nr:hypothetical protein [Burkholderiales bacterium]
MGEEPPPLSFAQQRLWFLAQLDTRASAAYLMAGSLRLQGRLDEAALARALDRIVARHEVLRTSLIQRPDGSVVQLIVAADVGLPLRVLDLSALPDPQAQAQRLAEEEACTPFDLAQAPLIRAVLLKLAAQDHILLLTMHHIASDGWSMGVLVNEFSALYAAFSTGLPDP